MAKTTLFSFELPEDLHTAAKVKAAQTGIPMAEICRRALTAWVEQKTPQSPQDDSE
ncbi:MAG: hypothetical protein H8D74_01135 [Chloroflexi bacterium]|nr:hypothetical protein [Chloroflexota bacterium]